MAGHHPWPPGASRSADRLTNGRAHAALAAALLRQLYLVVQTGWPHSGHPGILPIEDIRLTCANLWVYLERLHRYKRSGRPSSSVRCKLLTCSVTGFEVMLLNGRSVVGVEPVRGICLV